jgi:hypothetical protein
MPVSNYGVVIGTFDHFDRAQPVNGRWYHGHLFVSTPAGPYSSALDVYAQNGVGVQYRPLHLLDPAAFANIRSLPPGHHALDSGQARGPTGGGLDYVRDPRLTSKRGCLGLLPDPILSMLEFFLIELVEAGQGWITSDGGNALDALEPRLPGSERVYIFGAYYEMGPNGAGVHDVHMNQGDPPTSPDGSHHQTDDGVWQDGAVLIDYPDGSMYGWLVKFASQSLTTNDTTGLPQ